MKWRKCWTRRIHDGSFFFHHAKPGSTRWAQTPSQPSHFLDPAAFDDTLSRPPPAPPRSGTTGTSPGTTAAISLGNAGGIRACNPPVASLHPLLQIHTDKCCSSMNHPYLFCYNRSWSFSCLSPTCICSLSSGACTASTRWKWLAWLIGAVPGAAPGRKRRGIHWRNRTASPKLSFLLSLPRSSGQGMRDTERESIRNISVLMNILIHGFSLLIWLKVKTFFIFFPRLIKPSRFKYEDYVGGTTNSFDNESCVN